MNTNQGLSWFYYNPFFGHDRIVADGNTGIVESGINLALWGAVVGFGAHLMGAKAPVKWGIGTFAVLVAAEFLFNASASTVGPSIGPGGGAPPTAAIPTGSPQDMVNLGTLEQGGFGTVEEGGYGGQ